MRYTDLTNEAMTWSVPGMAIMHIANMYVIYKTGQEMINAVGDYDYKKVQQQILGIMTLGYHNGTKTSRVGSVYAPQKGFGPLLYYIVMANEGELGPNIHDVSVNAKKIWKWFYDNDYKKRPMTTHQDDEYLKYTYRLPNIMKNKALNALKQGEQINDNFLSMFEYFQKDEVERLISGAASDMIRKKMMDMYPDAF